MTEQQARCQVMRHKIETRSILVPMFPFNIMNTRWVRGSTSDKRFRTFFVSDSTYYERLFSPFY